MANLIAVLRRLVWAVGLVLAVLAINFTLIHAAPGDPAQVIAGEMGGGDLAVIASIKKAYGLDRPLPEQFVTYIGKSLHGDLGQSYLYNRPVLDMIADRVWPTILLVLTALIGAIVFAGAALSLLAGRAFGARLARWLEDVAQSVERGLGDAPLASGSPNRLLRGAEASRSAQASPWCSGVARFAPQGCRNAQASRSGRSTSVHSTIESRKPGSHSSANASSQRRGSFEPGQPPDSPNGV